MSQDLRLTAELSPGDPPAGASAFGGAPPLVLATGLFSLAYLATLASRLLEVPADTAWVRLLSSWACIAACLGFVSIGRRQTLSGRAGTVLAVCSVAIVFAVTRWNPGNAASLLLKDLAQLSFACVVGAFLARRIQDPELLLAIGVIVSVTDLWSVTRGVTKTLLASNAIDYFLLNFPVLLKPQVGYFIGTSDFILATVYIAFADKLGSAWWRGPVSMLIGMATAGTLAITLQRPLPVLPFMVPAFHLLIPGSRRMSREGLRLLAAGLAMVGLLALLYP